MRFVYDYDEEAPGGRELLGGKGIGLAEMTALGVPVPSGFTITTDACRAYMAAGKEVPEGLDAEVGEHIATLDELSKPTLPFPHEFLKYTVNNVQAGTTVNGRPSTVWNLSPQSDKERW